MGGLGSVRYFRRGKPTRRAAKCSPGRHYGIEDESARRGGHHCARKNQRPRRIGSYRLDGEFAFAIAPVSCIDGTRSGQRAHPQ